MWPASTVNALSVTSGRSGSNSRRQLAGVGLNSVYWLFSGHFALPSSSSSSAANELAIKAEKSTTAVKSVVIDRMIEIRTRAPHSVHHGLRLTRETVTVHFKFNPRLTAA